MTQKKSSFPGLVPIAKRVFYGVARSVPKIRKIMNETPQPNADSNTSYEAMKPEAYRWFRQDETVRRCIVTNAVYACLAAGFETEIEPLREFETEEELKKFQEQNKGIKDYIDAANRTVNLDYFLFVAQVNRSIYGKAGLEIIFTAGKPSRLISHNPQHLHPIVSEAFEFMGVGYDDPQTPKWAADEHNFLYFPNMALNADLIGLSDVEPIYAVCKARHNLLRKDLPEITASLWAPYAVLTANTDGMSSEDEDTFLDNLIESAKSGKSIAINKHVEATVVDRKIDLNGLCALLDKFEECVIRNFGTPRFLVNKPTENRATAYTEQEAYIGSTIATIQRFFKRELEAQWYAPLVNKALAANGRAGEKVELRVSHKWNPVRAADVYQMAAAVATLYSNGMGVLGDDLVRAYEMMGWPIKGALRQMEEKEKQQQQNPQLPPGTAPPNPGNNKDLPGDETVEENKDGDN